MSEDRTLACAWIQPAFPQERAAWAEAQRYGRRHEHSHVSVCSRTEALQRSAHPRRLHRFAVFRLVEHAQPFLLSKIISSRLPAGRSIKLVSSNGIDGASLLHIPQ